MKCPHCGGEVPMSASAPRWRREEDGTIRFSVTSNGMTGDQWIAHLEGKGDHVGPSAKSVLGSDDFVPTNGVTTEVAVLPGSFWSDDDRTTENVRAEAKKRKFRKLNAEVACLIRDMFTDEELAKTDLWWFIVMHAPIKDSDGDPNLLGVHRDDVCWWLLACLGTPLHGWNRGHAFAFAVPQVSA